MTTTSKNSIDSQKSKGKDSDDDGPDLILIVTIAIVASLVLIILLAVVLVYKKKCSKRRRYDDVNGANQGLVDKNNIEMKKEPVTDGMNKTQNATSATSGSGENQKLIV